MTARKLCAIESAAKANPKYKMVVVVGTPEKFLNLPLQWNIDAKGKKVHFMQLYLWQ